MRLVLTVTEREEVRAALHTTLALVEDRWCCGGEARDACGALVDPKDTTAVKFDIVGAVKHTVDKAGTLLLTLHILRKAVCDLHWCGHTESDLEVLAEWNDGVAAGVDEVLQLLRYALTLTEEEQIDVG